MKQQAVKVLSGGALAAAVLFASRAYHIDLQALTHHWLAEASNVGLQRQKDRTWGHMQ